MRLPRLLLSLLLLGLATMLPPRALGQGSPYTVTVPVADTSGAQRDQAFGDALAQVLVRVAGGQDLRGKPGYDDALKKAGGLVKQYQYQRGGAAPAAPGGISLQVSFDAGAVQQLIGQMGVASAGVKPPVLLMVQGADGKLLGQDALSALAQAASAHGYQVAYVDPAGAPDSGAVAKGDPAALAALAHQYHTGLVLAGRLQSTNADWSLIAGGSPQRWSDHGTGAQDLLAHAGDELAAYLGKQLNVIGTGGVSGELWVSGLHSATDYASLLAALRADPAVSDVSTVEAENDGVLLSLKSAIPLDGLAANLAAGGRLLQGDAHPGADASLRWLH
jgi:hypothetical protein